MPPAGGPPERPASSSPGDDDHLLSPVAGAIDAQEVSLRPQTLGEYVGQSRIKDNLRVFISAATARGEALDHVLLYGTPGLGKTTLAHVIAAEAGASLRTTSGPAIEKPGDLAALLTNLNARDVLFIDEIHRLPSIVEETLYPAMEDFHLDLIVGQGPSARSVKYPLPPFTLIGATTRVGLLTSPLRTRFGVTHLLEPYSVAELLDILARSARLLRVEAQEAGLAEIAKRSRGTPRVANRLLRRVRDFAEVGGRGVIDLDLARESLHRLEIDDWGLDLADRRLLETIFSKFRGGPVGLSTIAAALGEEKDTIEDIQEPYLIRLGLLERTPRGRCLTPLGVERARASAAPHEETPPPGDGPGQRRLF